MDYQWSAIDRVSKRFPRTRGDRPASAWIDRVSKRFPRTRGDRPLPSYTDDAFIEVSPHTRG